MSSNPPLDGAANQPSSDLPFLVTHWLSHFGSAPPTDANNLNHHSEEAKTAQQDAVERIRKATNDLAAAFTDLGAFGVALNVSLSLYVCFVCE